MDNKKTVFQKYEMANLLGKGTFAKVYLAKELKTGESVAIKVINKDHIKTDEMMQQIKREIVIMRLVRHPNIVELKEVMATKKQIYFVMEYVQGGKLFTKIEKGKLNEDLARKYFQQLISAIDFCHFRGIYHRDLKPENLLLDENEDLKISGFGLSALPEQLHSDGLLYTRCGTRGYIAPEVLNSTGYDGAKADIWSSGVVLYVLLAGFLPFEDENVAEMYRKISKAEYEIPPWISNEARRLISKLLIVNPEKRITIPAIMDHPWFKRNFTRPNTNLFDESDYDMFDKSSSSPEYLNAFEIITISLGSHLSILLGIDPEYMSMFKSSATVIVSKLLKGAKQLKFKVAKIKDFELSIIGPTESRKEKLVVTAEVLKVTYNVTVVKFSKSSGDALDYTKFCEEDIIPTLKDIVWT